MKIVVLEAESVGKDVSWDMLKKFGEVIVYGITPQETVVERILDADVIIPNKTVLDESNLKKAKHLKMICEAATGYNNIDIMYCKKRGIVVTNVKAYSTDIVAQHTFAMVLSLCGKLDYYTTYVEDGEYSASPSFTNISRPFHELAGKTWGIIGLGNIGRKVAKIATAFGMNVIYYSASGNTYQVPYKASSLDELLMCSDVVSVHAPLNEFTKGLLDYEAFCKMKKTSIFANVGRGPIVVEKDLAKALDEGRIMAAGIDVYKQEPLPKTSPLLQILDRDRIILTPHVAWGSVEARNRLVGDIALSIEAYEKGERRSTVY